MATRSQSWFDAEKLLPGESLIRQAPARLRTPASPPGWWEGTLVLTSDRLFFLPFVANPLVGADVAYWLADIEGAPAGRNRLCVQRRGSGAAGMTFHIIGLRLAPEAIFGERGKSWLYEMRRAQRHARPSYTFEPPTPQHRQVATG